MYQSRPVITSVEYNSAFFDPYLPKFTPSDDSFDFIKLNALPNQFIKFIKKSTESETAKNPKNLFTVANNSTVSNFHQKVLQLFMAFGLSFSDNDYINIGKLPLHKEILEMKLCLFLEDKDDNSFSFFEDFNLAKSLFDKSNLSAIFIFNSEDEIIPICIDNGNLSKAPIIVVYSEMSALLLFPSDFRFFSHFISDEMIGQNEIPEYRDIENEFLTLFTYEIVEDHWIPHICKKHFNRLIASYFPHQRRDMLSFDFKSLSEKNNENNQFSKVDLFGYIGKIKDIEDKLGIEYKGLRRSVPPKLLFYKHSDNCAYLLFFIPDNSPGIRDCSPASPLYIEAASHAYHYMRSCCSTVVIIPSQSSKPKDNGEYFNGTINGLNISAQTAQEEEEKKNKEFILFGSYETITNVKIFRTPTNSKGNNNDSDIKEEIYEFNSLQHFFIWIDWTLRSRPVSFALDERKYKEVKIGNSSFYSEIKKTRRFHERSHKKVSCDISGEVFALIRKYMMKTRDNTSKKDIFVISRFVAFEDGSIKIYRKGRDDNVLEYKTYKFYRLCESPTKTINPIFSEKYAEIKNLESNFTIINSWTMQNKGVLTLLYSDYEKKVMIIFLKKYYNDAIPPFPIFEIKSDFKKADEKNMTIERSNYNSLMYNSAFCPNSRNLLFSIIEDESPKIVSVIIDPNYTKVTRFKKIKMEDFSPLEAKNFEKIPLFSNFIINENGNDAVIFYRAQADFRKKNDYKNIEMSHYYFCLFFDPITLSPLKTLKMDDFEIKLGENGSKACKIDEILIFPILYLNGSILLIIYSNGCYITAVFSYNEKEKIFMGTNEHFCGHGSLDQIYFANIRNIPKYVGVMKLMNTPYIVNNIINSNRFEINAFYNYKDTSDKKYPFFYRMISSYSDYQPISYHRFLKPFKGEAIGQLVLNTEYLYGTSLSDQSVIPSPNTLPLQFSNVMIDKSERKSDGSFLIEKELGDFINAIKFSKIQYLIGLVDSDSPDSMFTTISPFIYLIFSAPQLVVDKAFVNSETSSTKRTSHLCYLTRANRFPTFVFLRMTTKCPCFQVSVISENGSSLLNHLTGIGFCHFHSSSLAIGSHPVPHISKHFGFSDDKMRIIPENIDNLINVIGSLFTVNEGTFTQAVAFISACISSDTIIIEFSEPSKLIEFFRKFFDSADIISNEFNLTDYFSSAIATKTNTSQIKVAIFCDLGNNSLYTINRVLNEVDRLYEERSLNKDSISHKIFDQLQLNFFQTSASSSQSAQELFQKGFLNVSESQKITADAVLSIKKMSFIFGAQVDHDANMKTNIEECLNTSYVKRDENGSGKEALYNLSNQILNEAYERDEKSKEKAKNLCKLAAESGNNEAMYSLYKKYKVNFNNNYYLYLAAENGNIDAQLELIKNKYKGEAKLEINKYYIEELQKIVENGHHQGAIFELAKCFKVKGKELFDMHNRMKETFDCFEKSLQYLEKIRNNKEYHNDEFIQILEDIFSISIDDILLKPLPGNFPELAMDFVESELENDYKACMKILKFVPMEKINRHDLITKILKRNEPKK